MNKSITVGMRLFDEGNGRYITVNDVKYLIFSCLVEEITENGETVITGNQLFTEVELRHFKEL